MCGRFTIGGDEHDFRAWAEALTVDPATMPTGLPEAFTPAATIPIVHRMGARVVIDPARWGLAPSWMRDPLAGRPLINVRSETAGQKFGRDLAGHAHGGRCVIPAAGFWIRRDDQGQTGSRRGRLFARVPGQRVFGFAGVWAERVHEGAPLRTAAILTTEAQPELARYHHRVPVILDHAGAARWLDPAVPFAELMRLCANEVDLELEAA